MAKLTILSEERINEMYPKRNSLVAQAVENAIRSGCSIALVQNYAFNEEHSVAIDLCQAMLKDENPRYKFIRLIDVSRLEQKEVVITFKEE